MKSALVALAASICLVVPALAQDAAPPPPAGAPAPADAGGAGGKGGKMKAAIAACRTEVQSQGVKGPDRKKAMMDCVTREHPEFAGRMQCRQDGKAKGLSGDDLKSFIRTCARSSHG